MLDRVKQWCSAKEKEWKPVVWMLSIGATVIVAIVGANWFMLKPRIDQAKREAIEAARVSVTSPDTLNEIAAKLRPYGVIEVSLDARNFKFEHDAGLGDVLDSAAFTSRGPMEGMGITKAVLNLNMKRFSAAAPIVRPLDPSVYVHSFWRTNKYDWAFELRPGVFTDDDSSGKWRGMEPGKSYRFFIEAFSK